MLGNINFEKLTPTPPPEDILFNFSAREIEEMAKKGMTDTEIEKKRKDVLNRITQAQSIKH